MFVRKFLGAFVLATASAVSLAAPVEYDTPDFHLIVCRPFDSWSGDLSTMDDQLEAISKRRARITYMAFDGGKSEYGAGRSWLNGPTDDALTKDTIALVQSRGFSISYHGVFWRMGAPTYLEPGDYPRFRDAQSALYDAVVRKQGEPDQIAGSICARRVFGNLLALGAMGVGLNKFGGTGGYVVATAFAGDISQLPEKVRQSMALFDLPPLDKFEISKIEVFPVGAAAGASPGQVIVAYKTPPTDETRHAALVQALASLTGSDTTPEGVEAARAADLQRRKDYWNACVSAHQCGDTKDQVKGDAK